MVPPATLWAKERALRSGTRPTGATAALEQIKAMYAVEEEIRKLKLAGEAKQLHRLTHSKPLVEIFFAWVDEQLKRQGFTPSNPFIQALNYVRERRARCPN